MVQRYLEAPVEEDVLVVQGALTLTATTTILPAPASSNLEILQHPPAVYNDNHNGDRIHYANRDHHTPLRQSTPTSTRVIVFCNTTISPPSETSAIVTALLSSGTWSAHTTRASMACSLPATASAPTPAHSTATPYHHRAAMVACATETTILEDSSPQILALLS